jgi:hypothetical protein
MFCKRLFLKIGRSISRLSEKFFLDIRNYYGMGVPISKTTFITEPHETNAPRASAPWTVAAALTAWRQAPQ